MSLLNTDMPHLLSFRRNGALRNGDCLSVRLFVRLWPLFLMQFGGQALPRQPRRVFHNVSSTVKNYPSLEIYGCGGAYS